MQDDRAQKLHGLLENSCNIAEMRDLIRRLPGGLLPHLHEGPMTRAEFAAELVELLGRHDRIDAELFRGLLAFRPKRRAEIMAVASRYDILDIDASATATRGPSVAHTSHLQGTRSRRRFALVGALGSLAIVAMVLFVFVLSQLDSAEPTDTSRILAATPAPSPAGATLVPPAAPTQPADSGESMMPYDGTPPTEFGRALTPGAAKSGSGSAPRPTVEPLEREACISLKKRTRSALSTCAKGEALGHKEAAVNIIISSGGQTVEVTPRSGQRYPGYLQCARDVVKPVVADIRLENAKIYKCELVLP